MSSTRLNVPAPASHQLGTTTGPGAANSGIPVGLAIAAGLFAVAVADTQVGPFVVAMLAAGAVYQGIRVVSKFNRTG